MYQTITPRELEEKIRSGEKFRLIDVREPLEYEIARIDGAELLPLSRAGEWVGELQPEEEIVFFCHHGGRSTQVCEYLSRQGFENLYNLVGGIDLYSVEIDKNIPRY
ncbi:MAG: rhodanese-like domain-containing protein [Acidobacteriota bacterium]|nr:rhodanese-like domain-containing protein [Acidobacteriota bacterium]